MGYPERDGKKSDQDNDTMRLVPNVIDPSQAVHDWPFADEAEVPERDDEDQTDTRN